MFWNWLTNRNHNVFLYLLFMLYFANTLICAAGCKRDGPHKVYVIGWLIVTGVFLFAIYDQYSIIRAQTRVQERMNEKDEKTSVLTQHIIRDSDSSKYQIEVHTDSIKITKTIKISLDELKDLMEDAKNLKETSPSQHPGGLLVYDRRLKHWVDIDGQPAYRFGNQTLANVTSVPYQLLSDKLQMYDRRIPDVY